MNELEDTLTDLSTYASILSDLASNPDEFVEQDYLNSYASFLRQGPDIGYDCKTKACPLKDGRQFNVDFFGNFEQVNQQADEEKVNLTDEERDYLLANCDFGCKMDGKKISPYFKENYTVTEVNYQDKIAQPIWNKQSWYVSPESETSETWQELVSDEDFST